MDTWTPIDIIIFWTTVLASTAWIVVVFNIIKRKDSK
jgi:hypothetical protein